ncbi:MAG: S-methyl-5-thioribose-1-phosphate isomerase [Desulfurococcales archaeon]|nr:S-methyl-5-thioribose-1-phosphate isomerase [Desulfurococcales archaeon]
MIKQAFKTIEWLDGKLKWLNTLKLPYEEEYIESSNYERVAEAIERMEIRGAPAIGVAAAFAVALAAYNFRGDSAEDLRKHVLRVIERLRRTRPTAVNLFWALSRMESVLDKCANDVTSIRTALVSEALRIYNEDIEVNVKIGEIGSKVIEDGDTILTHCNAGALATAGYGTALGVIRAAWYSGKRIKVIATETRPVLQGARLTVWELKKEGIPVTLITDNMVGYAMSKGLINKIVVGADRILLSGHVINKIGTYTIAVLAKYHGIPFYVAAPTSTVDAESKLSDVVIEERNPDEVRYVLGKLLITVKDVPVLNPAFDITPPELVTGIITEKGIATQPLSENLRKMIKLK